ncbi:TFIIB-type zinc ribbon-containing protein [Pediococcus pentosaceus]|uniref:TFIIB-type zinc ribbon-containing protein n=1 Tax=Pediococcus pentosaceus TaxID=1255 RepID=UPI0013305DD9|nr:TFIIB-type zinc ribbon-containing protein [Pediococcus pentosaceus]KAF0506974.1 TFIIB-type zinc ribbon-containing protein [Pediococcus pentosaceus]MBF7139412.1 TFIIB-type zinc ribbon-containing protein [Pediococcus pentosaceus]
MEVEVQMKIEIPTDDDGFMLLKCPHCGDFFKLIFSDMEDYGILHIYCPYCGQVGDSYLTGEVIKLAEAMTKNFALQQMHQVIKRLERKHKRGLLTFKAGQVHQKVYESPVLLVVDTLIKQYYDCCNRNAKIKPSMKIAGTYCPFCGVKDFEYK